jgi:hypothetical protein
VFLGPGLEAGFWRTKWSGEFYGRVTKLICVDA